MFEKFWNAYPKKTHRAEAFDAFERHDAVWERIIDGAIRYAESEQAETEERYLKNPVAFINDQTWRQRFKPGAKARARAAAEARANNANNPLLEIGEKNPPPKCKHNPEQSVLKCDQCRAEWLAESE